MEDRMKKIIQSIKYSTKKVDILSVNENILNDISKSFEINPKSLLGTIIYNTGGIVVDNWIRIYGAGNANFYQRNQDFPYSNILVAEDILGGLFAIMDNGNIGYFAPDTLEWEDNGLSYSQFLYWCFHGDTDAYYNDYRWDAWQDEVSNLSIENGVSFYPFLWVKGDLEERYREVIPMKEMIQMEFDFVRQLRE